MRRHLARILLLGGVAAAPSAIAGDEIILAPDEFLRETFGATPPAAQFRWLDNDAQAALSPILGHAYPQARVRYWRDGARTAWVVDDVGKEFPITAGFVVSSQALEQARVLIYRESRGGEIRFPAFLKQFIGERLAGDRLSNQVDSISGATLSVEAMQRMARAVLTLDRITP